MQGVWEAWYRAVASYVQPWFDAHQSSAFPPRGTEAFAIALAGAMIVVGLDLWILTFILRWLHPRWTLWRKARRRAVRVLLVAVPVVVFFVVLESGLRQWVAAHPSGTLWRPHPLYFWGFRPDMADARIFEYENFTFHTNRSGFRGDDVPYAKAPGEYRILFTGDSNTFAQGVSQRDSFPMVLQRMLADRYRDRKITVLNAAVCGYSLSQSYYLYQEEGTRYGVDLVVVGSHKWSISTDHLKNRDTIASNAVLRRLQVWANDLVLYQTLRKNVSILRGEQPVDLTIEDFGSEKVKDLQYFEYCKRFLETCRASGTALIYVAPPPPSEGTFDLWQGGDLVEFARQIGPQDRVAFMTWHQDLPDAEFCLSPDDRHFSAAGNASIARQFYEVIVKSGFI